MFSIHLLRHNSDLVSDNASDPIILAPKKRHAPIGGGTLPNFPSSKSKPPPIPTHESSLFKMTPNFIEAIPLANTMYSAPGFLNIVGVPVAKQPSDEALQAAPPPSRVEELETGLSEAFKKLGRAVARKHALRVEVESVQAELLTTEDRLRSAEEANGELHRKIDAQRYELAELNRRVMAQRAEIAELVKIKSKRGIDALHLQIGVLKDENASLYTRIEAMGGDVWELQKLTGPGGATMLSDLTRQVESARAREELLVRQLEMVRNENSRLAVIVHNYAKKEQEVEKWNPESGKQPLWNDSDSEVWSFPADGPHFVR